MSEQHANPGESAQIAPTSLVRLAARRLGLFGVWDSASYWLTRFVILRLLGLVYLVAFLAAANQIVPLVGNLVGSWLPPLSADDPRLRQFLEAHGWQGLDRRHP